MNVHAPATAFPRFKLPARLVLPHGPARVLDWSPTGVAFVDRRAGLAEGDTLEAELGFDIGGTSLATEIVGQVDRYDSRTGRGELAYRPKNGEGASVPAFVIEEYLAGRIVVMDGMLTKSETLRATPQPDDATRTTFFGGVRRVLGLGVITLGGALALYYLGSSIYDRLFVFEAASAQVAFNTVELDAPAAGTLTAVAKPGPIAKGASVFRIVDANGAASDIASPCDCTVADGGRVTGSFTSAGSNVVKLILGDSAPTIAVAVAFPDMRRVYEGAAVDLKYLDGQWVHGAHIKSIRGLNGEQNSLVVVEVDPGRTLTPGQYGEPVYAHFDTAPWRRG